MTRIRATCPSCGEVELRPDEVVLRRAAVPSEHTYRFDCPGCATQVVKPADEHVAELLVTGGVPVEEVRHRALHPELPPEGPPLTLDDLLDLHLALGDPCWFDRLVAVTPR